MKRYRKFRGRIARCALGVVLISGGLATTGCNVQVSGGSGTLKVLVTDKPYPFDLLEEALITITRVEVRRADDASLCTDALCDDGLVCNGVETCDTTSNTCVAGSAPSCVVDEACDEIRGGCSVACADDTECDDGLFCNGSETCDTTSGLCDPGTPFACQVDEVCDEATQACVADTSPVDPVDDGSPFIVIYDESTTGGKSFNLLDLQNGRTDLLADTTIPVGHYTQMRIFITQGEVKVKEVDDAFILKVPSGAQSGIKLNFDFEVLADTDTTLLLDVDLSRAFTPIPGGKIDDPSSIREFKFSPSVAMRLINLVEAGSISGTVTTLDNGVSIPVAGASVTAIDSNDQEVTTTSIDADGTYTLAGLPRGTYQVQISAAGFDDTDIVHVVVVSGDTTAGVDAELVTAP